MHNPKKKRIFTVLLSIILIISTVGAVNAAENGSSSYSGYTNEGSWHMYIYMDDVELNTYLSGEPYISGEDLYMEIIGQYEQYYTTGPHPITVSGWNYCSFSRDLSYPLYATCRYRVDYVTVKEIEMYP